MRKLVTIQIIENIISIPEADCIELAKIKGWQVVVEKNKHKVGDKVLYFEIDSFLPVKTEYEFLLRGSSPKKMLVDGKEIEGIRLKTIKLKNTLSQGLILSIPEELKDIEIGEDVSEKLGVIKYEMTIPAKLSGIIKGSFPSFLPKTDEERIQNMPEILNGYYVSEKIDGTSVSYYKKDGVFGVCSRNLELSEGETTQWKIARELKIQEKLFDNFAIQGELVGEGIQENPLKIKGHKIYFYNAYNIKAGVYLGYNDFVGIITSMGLQTVPVIDENFVLPDLETLLLYAEGKSLINSEVEREGIVIRPKIEMNYKGSRLSFKVISNKYLLKHGV